MRFGVVVERSFNVVELEEKMKFDIKVLGQTSPKRNKSVPRKRKSRALAKRHHTEFANELSKRTSTNNRVCTSWTFVAVICTKWMNECFHRMRFPLCAVTIWFSFILPLNSLKRISFYSMRKTFISNGFFTIYSAERMWWPYSYQQNAICL